MISIPVAGARPQGSDATGGDIGGDRDAHSAGGERRQIALSIDHRAVDGATAASFLTRLRELIEEPLDIVI